MGEGPFEIPAGVMVDHQAVSPFPPSPTMYWIMVFEADSDNQIMKIFTIHSFMLMPFKSAACSVRSGGVIDMAMYYPTGGSAEVMQSWPDGNAILLQTEWESPVVLHASFIYDVFSSSVRPRSLPRKAIVQTAGRVPLAGADDTFIGIKSFHTDETGVGGHLVGEVWVGVFSIHERGESRVDLHVTRDTFVGSEITSDVLWRATLFVETPFANIVQLFHRHLPVVINPMTPTDPDYVLLSIPLAFGNVSSMDENMNETLLVGNSKGGVIIAYGRRDGVVRALEVASMQTAGFCVLNDVYHAGILHSINAGPQSGTILFLFGFAQFPVLPLLSDVHAATLDFEVITSALENATETVYLNQSTPLTRVANYSCMGSAVGVGIAEHPFLTSGDESVLVFGVIPVEPILNSTQLQWPNSTLSTYPNGKLITTTFVFQNGSYELLESTVATGWVYPFASFGMTARGQLYAAGGSGTATAAFGGEGKWTRSGVVEMVRGMTLSSFCWMQVAAMPWVKRQTTHERA